jgi:pimeloyl-ACP methyl ester carboxylesterase
VALISDATKQFVEGVAAEATRVETPCGDGTMVWRVWGSGPPLLLLHGGYGSWTHWIRNVLPLARRFRVIAPDTPGLGESATPPEPHTAEGIAAILVEGIAAVLAPGEQLHMAGFSFGGVIGGHVAAQLGERARGFIIVGSNGLGLVRQSTPLERAPVNPSEAEALAAARNNLSSLMIHDPSRIDELALYLQMTNAPRARVRSRRFSRSDTLARVLPSIQARLSGIWGGRDATAYPNIDERARVLRGVQPGIRFEIVPGAGHWVAYEAADRFNPLLSELATP